MALCLALIRIIGQCSRFPYIDDFGGFVFRFPLQNGGPDLGLVKRILELCRRVRRSFGMGCHKEVTGPQMDPLGAMVEDRGEEIVEEPTDRRETILDNGAWDILELGVTSGEALRRAIGH